MHTFASKRQGALRFSLATLVLLSLFCGSLMGVWTYRYEWVISNVIKTKTGPANYLRFNGASLVASEWAPNDARTANIYDSSTGRLISSQAFKAQGVYHTAIFEGKDRVVMRSMPICDSRHSHKHFSQMSDGITPPDDFQTNAYKWDNFDFVQFSWKFDAKRKNISLFEPRGIFFTPRG